jgi:ribonucleoside-diphosphate reductase alpha chain
LPDPNTALGRGIDEGKAEAVSKGLTRGAPLKVMSKSGMSGDPKGFGGGSGGQPARSAPTALGGGSNIRLLSTGSTVGGLALKPELDDEPAPFKRDYEERAKELAEDIAFEEDANAASETFSSEAPASAAAALFTGAAAQAAADAKALAAERPNRAIMQGYTGNMCSECQNFTTVRNGTCEKCDTCGATSGCS